MNKNFVAVVTTIQPPTACIKKLADCLREHDGLLIVVGDRKGPSAFDLPGADFLSLAMQKALEYSLAGILPEGHYARKNIGYLRAISLGAKCIYETDDDNAPMDGWCPRNITLNEVAFVPEKTDRWINVYRYFSSGHIWPRGLPLGEINTPIPPIQKAKHPIQSLVQQGLANQTPDVDALWRLIFGQTFDFEPGLAVYLSSGNWCPFNSQNTWWWPPTYPLLYIPSFCSFRMCDIWRSFVAQRCLWAIGSGVTFFAPDVLQERNVHSLMKDFEDEIPGYLQNAKIAKILENLRLNRDPSGIGENLRSCYKALFQEGIFIAKELELIDAWLHDVRLLSKQG